MWTGWQREGKERWRAIQWTFGRVARGGSMVDGQGRERLSEDRGIDVVMWKGGSPFICDSITGGRKGSVRPSGRKRETCKKCCCLLFSHKKSNQKNLSIWRRFCVLTRNLFMMMSMTPFLCSPTKIWLAQLVFIRWVNKISTLPKRSGQHFNRKLWFEHTFRVLRSPVCYFHIWGHPVMYFAFINFWYSSTFHCTEIMKWFGVWGYEAPVHTSY